MEMRPNIESSKLTPTEIGLYKQFVVKNPGITEEDFLELRKFAVGASPAVQEFYKVNNVLMQEKPDDDEKNQIEGRN